MARGLVWAMGLGGANAGEVASRLAITETHVALTNLDRGEISLARILYESGLAAVVAVSRHDWCGLS